MGRRTPLYDLHVAAGARMVDFGGWDMPVGYGSQIEEHHAVRRDAGMFDVSHMCTVDLRGAGVRPLLLRLLANDVGRLTAPGKALYSCMLRPDGGVIDDLIACYLDEKWFRLVVNAGTADKDLAWIKEHAKQIGVAVVPRRDLALIAVQGPGARAKSTPLLPEAARAGAASLGVFFGASFDDWFVSRTGYTGEDGFEIALPAESAADLWQALAGAGVAPCGLGARDTLRLEAGMNLYGNDMDETVTPLESGLAWTVALDGNRDFVGKEALVKQRAAGVPRMLTGLLLLERGVLRSHQKVHAAA
ncbi:MAG TPA: glycine cleavage system aminomethyltransferase GcvT, partial [Steroidobacteraceae bacterium]|nr:glycine cleavage system aminomethyltransferase GcvT [Steroidobacteraceae bacterium]